MVPSQNLMLLQKPPADSQAVFGLHFFTQHCELQLSPLQPFLMVSWFFLHLVLHLPPSLLHLDDKVHDEQHLQLAPGHPLTESACSLPAQVCLHLPFDLLHLSFAFLQSEKNQLLT